jgi:glucose 1-dehydrogenase
MGAATAELFAQAGAKVLAADIDEQNGQATVDRIEAAGGTASFLKTDVSQPRELEAMVRTAVERYGRLDCAVNNAARGPEAQAIHELEEAQFDSIIAINLKSVAFCLKYQIAQLLSQGDGGGSIVNIGSVNSFRPQPRHSVYTASKHGVHGLTKNASQEVAPLGIRVNMVCPGGIDTPMMRNALAEYNLTEEEMAPALSLFGRFGKPEEVAHGSLWLCSDNSSYVTGIALMVDAGYTSR